jgi:hypothetical protein
MGLAGRVFRVRHPRLAALAVSLGAGLLLLAVVPGNDRLARLDRAGLGWLAGEPGRIVGEGTFDEPWAVEEMARPDSVPPAAVLRLHGEDEGYFERVPPPPADLMVVLARLEDREIPAIGFGYPLQWDDPDTLALEAMRRIMDRAPGVVLGHSLTDSTAPEAVAAPFQRSSIAYREVRGDGSKIPVVNRVSGQNPEFGGARGLAGFTRLENEAEESDRAYLLARWSDRVVFALPLAVEIVRRGLSFEDVEVEVGREIRLGRDGPVIPVDFRGRVDLPDDSPEAERHPATAVIAETLPEGWPGAGRGLFFTDERLLGAKEVRTWAARMPRIDAAIRTAPHPAGLRPLPRPDPLAELAALLGLSLAVGASLGARRLPVRLLVGVGWLVAVAAGLALLARAVPLAPLSLAFLAVPAAAIPTVLWVDASRRIEVVDTRRAAPTKKTAAASPSDDPPAAKSGKKRRRKKRRA